VNVAGPLAGWLRPLQAGPTGRSTREPSRYVSDPTRLATLPRRPCSTVRRAPRSPAHHPRCPGLGGEPIIRRVLDPLAGQPRGRAHRSRADAPAAGRLPGAGGEDLLRPDLPAPPPPHGHQRSAQGHSAALPEAL